MNDIRFKLKTSKLDKSGFAPVFMVFQHSGHEFVYATGEKCRVSEWDTEKQRFRRSMPGYQEANEGLEQLREKLRKVYRSALLNEVTITNQLLREGLRPSKTVSKDILTLYGQYLDYCRVANYKPSTLRSMGNTGSRLCRFLSDSRLNVNAYTYQAHNQFTEYQITVLGLHPNSIANTNKHLRTFFNWCKSQRIALHPEHAPIKTEWLPSERIFLTEPELHQIAAVGLTDAMSRVRDSFLFQCYTGLRYAELSRLQQSNIEQRAGYKVLTFIPEKSVSARNSGIKRVEVPILPEAEIIVNRYAGNYRLLPVLSYQKMNDYVKYIARVAGIDSSIEQVRFILGKPEIVHVPKYELVSSHIARHTFATLSLIKGVPLEVVSKVLGHSEIKTTMIYAKIVDEYKNNAILSAWSKKPAATDTDKARKSPRQKVANLKIADLN